jgi:hypothetical protein
MAAIYVLTLLKDIEIKEFEWYLRDYFFRQSNNNQGSSRQKFQKEKLGIEMMNLYLRYRDSNLEKLNELVNIVSENLLSHQVIIKKNSNTAAEDNDSSFELTSKLSRLRCSKCFYISYLSNNEPKNCLRCLSTELHDFPKIQSYSILVFSDDDIVRAGCYIRSHY